MSNGSPPVGPRTPAVLFPHDYDPTASAALETMRQIGTPSPVVPPQARPDASAAQPGVGGNMPPWFGTLYNAMQRLGQTFTQPGQTAKELLASRPIPAGANPLDPKTMLDFAGSIAGEAPPELGPAVTRTTRPVLADIENAAAGAEGVRMPQAAIVSASLGNLSAKENAARHAGMSDLLRAWGVEHVEVQGRWKNPTTGKWETEKSYLIPDFERAQAVHLGDRFGQHSVITIGGQEPGLHDVSTGQTTPFSGVRQAGRREAHTVLPSGAKISFDFEGAPRQTGTAAPAAIPQRGVSELGNLANEYRKTAGVTGPKLPHVEAVDPIAGKSMANAYERLQSNPSDPQVQAAYKAFTDETHAQAEHLKAAGYTPQYVDKDPYTSSKAMLKDLRDNKSIRVLKTQPDQAHPLMTPEQNDEFRFVHDVYGHGASGNSFAAKGEENAARDHATMYSPLAQRAMLTETRGQNSWFNFGPHADLPASQRPFAEQKAALWPLEHSGQYPGEGQPKLPPGAPEVLGASDPKYAYRTPTTYHGTLEQGFDVPTQSSDIGPHTGTKAQAEDLSSQKATLIGEEPEAARLLRLYSNVKNPLRITRDLGTWQPTEVAEEIANHPEIKGTPAEKVFRQLRDASYKDTRQYDTWEDRRKAEQGWLGEIKTALKGHGYDAIEYPNTFEGEKTHVFDSQGNLRRLPQRAVALRHGASSGYSTIHLDPTKTLSTTPRETGMAIPREDVSDLAMGVAHLSAGTKSPQQFAAAVAKEHPQVGAQMQASPWLANKMYGTAQKYRGMIQNMPTTSEAIADALSPAGEGIRRWYNQTDKVLQDAGLSPQERDVFHRIGAISSIQKSPKDELSRALKAFDAWSHGELMADVPGYTKVQRGMLQAIADDQPWSKVTHGEKVSGYVLARQGQPSALAIDRHIAEYYGGKQNLNDTEKGIVEGRLRHDAAKAGMPDREFQAAVWGAKPGYKPGFGNAGATLEDWLRYHLASGQHERLLERFPGFQKLAEEGAIRGEGLPE